MYPRETKLALVDLAEEHGLPILSDEVYGDLAYDGPVEPLGKLRPDAAIIAYSSLSKAYIAPGWRGGWMAVAPTPRLNDALAAIKKLADGRLCSPGPMQYAIEAALRGDRSHQKAFNAALELRARLTADRMNAIPGMRCVMPRGAFYAMPQVSLPPGKTDEDFVLGLLRETGVLVVYGSGFGADPKDGAFRIVFLALARGARRASTTTSRRSPRASSPRPDASPRWPPDSTGLGAHGDVLVRRAHARRRPGRSRRSLTTGVPSDLGDPLLNDWILAWNARHAAAAARRRSRRARRRCAHANIFHPAPYTLGYSELFVTQTLLILPVYALTANILLGYNLLFLAVFVLSGLGMYLFVRELTGDWRAGFVAGAALRVRAVSLSSGAASAGDVVAVDAVRAVRTAAVVRAD